MQVKRRINWVHGTRYSGSNSGLAAERTQILSMHKQRSRYVLGFSKLPDAGVSGIQKRVCTDAYITTHNVETWRSGNQCYCQA